MVDFSKFTNEQLWEIYSDANGYRWNPLLGDKPDGFDELPISKRWWQFWIKRTKRTYTSPVYWITKDLIPEDFYNKKMKEHSRKVMESLSKSGNIEVLIQGAYANGLPYRSGRKFLEHMSKEQAHC